MNLRDDIDDYVDSRDMADEYKDIVTPCADGHAHLMEEDFIEEILSGMAWNG